MKFITVSADQRRDSRPAQRILRFPCPSRGYSVIICCGAVVTCRAPAWHSPYRGQFMTQPVAGDGELRGLRLVYPEQPLPLRRVVDHLAAVDDLWNACFTLSTALHDSPALERQRLEDGIAGLLAPLREMAGRLAGSLETRVQRETGRPPAPFDETGPVDLGRRRAAPQRSAATAECLEALRTALRQVAPARTQPLAKYGVEGWRSALASHLADAAPVLTELVELTTTRPDLAVEREYAVRLLQTLRMLEGDLRAGAVPALPAAPGNGELHLHYLTNAPRFDMIATVSSADPVTAWAVHVLAAIAQDPPNAGHWLPQWLEQQTTQRPGGWGRFMGTQPTLSREHVNVFTASVRACTPSLFAGHPDMLVAGLGEAPQGLR